MRDGSCIPGTRKRLAESVRKRRGRVLERLELVRRRARSQTCDIEEQQVERVRNGVVANGQLPQYLLSGLRGPRSKQVGEGWVSGVASQVAGKIDRLGGIK